MRSSGPLPGACLVALALALGTASAAAAQASPGSVATLPSPRSPDWSPHWVWVSNPLLERLALVDLDDGRFLGMVDCGYGAPSASFGLDRPELYVPGTYYSRGTRGVRTDVVTFVSAQTLSPVGEVVIPPKRATGAITAAHQARSDDGRFLAVFNLTPATSISIVDLDERRLASEISTPGCGLVFAAGARRFFSVCGNGALLVITLDDRGRELSKTRTARFFDPMADPVTEKAVRFGDEWLFVSFGGVVHPVDVGAAEIAFGEPWPLFDDADLAESWRIGGIQHLAIHEPTGRFYSLVHRGGPDGHKEAGEEVWVYDLAERRRVQRIALHSPGFNYLGFPIEPAPDSFWYGVWYWLLDSLAPPLVTQIQVTPDGQPLLFGAAQAGGGLVVYDALTGELQRRIQAIGFTTGELNAPWTGGGR